MQNYKQYHVLADTSEILHLIQSQKRKRFFLFKYCVFPFALLIILLFALFTWGKNIPMGFNYLAATIVLLLSFSLLLHKYVTEIKITGTTIFFSKKFFLFTQQINIATATINKIILAKNGKLIFEVKHKKYAVSLKQTNAITAICNKLENITNFTIINK